MPGNPESSVDAVARLEFSIGVGGTFLRPGRVGGAEFMLYNLLAGLVEAHAHVLFLLESGCRTDESFDRRMAEAEGRGQLARAYLPSAGNRFVTEALHARNALKASGVQHAIFPNYFTPPTPKGTRVITSILDLQYLHYPEFFSARKRAWLRLAHEMSLRSADRVTVISDFVRDDLLSRYGKKFESKVVTVPVGIDWTRFEKAKPPNTTLPADRPFILSVSSHYPHKNLATLLRAFARIAQEVPHDLLLVGQRREQLVGVSHHGPGDLDSLTQRLGISDRVHLTGHASDAALAWCYRNAALFAFPSLFEGFGMPVVEALGMGLPVVTTRCGSIPEISHGLATMVSNPTDDLELADAIKGVLSNPLSHKPSAGQALGLQKKYHPLRVASQFIQLLGHF